MFGWCFCKLHPTLVPAVCRLEDLSTHWLPYSIHPRENGPSRGGRQGRAPLTHVGHRRVFLGLLGFDHPRGDPDVLLIRKRGRFHLVHVVRFSFLAISLLIVKGREKSNMLGSK